MTVEQETEPTTAPAGPSAVDAVQPPERIVEAVLMVAPEPVPASELAVLVGLDEAATTALCRALAERYAEEERGFVLVEVAGGWRFQSHPDLAGHVERYILEGQSARLSAAALETLAIVAYKQPISRAQVAAIRGVGVDAVVRTLEQRGYIVEVARDPGPGQAVLFGTTPYFLERLGMASLSDLPPVAEFVPGADVVEQLEQGLRPAPPVAPTADVEPSDAGPADTEPDDDASFDPAEPDGDTTS